MKAIQTPIGDVVVLGPCEACGVIEQHWGKPSPWCDRPTVGDTVDVEVECPTCEGTSWRWSDVNERDRLRCGCGSGTVTVQRTVAEVLPIALDGYDDDPVYDGDLVSIDIKHVGDLSRTPSGTLTIFYRGNIVTIPHSHLPDAQPGGVVLVLGGMTQ